jgi:predicted nucleic acid-binding protein
VIVLDASMALELLLGGSRAGRLRELLRSGERLCAPHLLDIEVAHVLRRYQRARALTPSRAGAAIEDLAELPLARHPHTPLLARIWELRDNLTGYDAAYVALAELMEAPLFTCDAKLAAAPGHRARIELFT